MTTTNFAQLLKDLYSLTTSNENKKHYESCYQWMIHDWYKQIKEAILDNVMQAKPDALEGDVVLSPLFRKNQEEWPTYEVLYKEDEPSFDMKVFAAHGAIHRNITTAMITDNTIYDLTEFGRAIIHDLSLLATNDGITLTPRVAISLDELTDIHSKVSKKYINDNPHLAIHYSL